MITDAEVERVPGATVYGADGEKIGKAGAVYRDDQSGRPEWMTVQTGLFGSSETFVPLGEATFEGGDLRVPFDKARVKDAPRVDAEGHLDISEEDRLFEHYGMRGAQGSADQGRTDADAAGRHDSTADGRVTDRIKDRVEDRVTDRKDDRDDRSDGRVTDRIKDRVEDRVTDRRDDDGPKHSAGVAPAAAGAAGVGSLGLVAAAKGQQGTERDQSEAGRQRQPQTAEWRDESGARSASGLSSSPVAGGTSRSERGPDSAGGTSERRPRLSQWVLVERSSIIEVSPEEAERLAADRGQGTGR